MLRFLSAFPPLRNTNTNVYLTQNLDKIIKSTATEQYELLTKALYAAVSGEKEIATAALNKATEGILADYGFGCVRIAEVYFYLGDTDQAKKYLFQAMQSKEAYQVSFAKEAAEVALLLNNEELLVKNLDYVFVKQHGAPYLAIKYLLRLSSITDGEFAKKLFDICIAESWGLSAFKIARAFNQKDWAKEVLNFIWSGNYKHSNRHAEEESVKEATIGALLWLQQE